MKAIVLGAGISGLSLAHFLKKGGHEVTILEASDRVGGWIRTDRVEGHLFERGPRSIRTTGGEATLELIRELGIEGEVIEASPAAKQRFLWSGSRLHQLPTGPISMLTSPLLHGLRLRALCERFVRKGTGVDESIHTFFSRRFGDKVATRLIDPVVTGIFAGDTRSLSMKNCFPCMWKAEQEHGSIIKGRSKRPKGRILSFKGGMSTLTDRLAEGVSGAIHLQTPATQILDGQVITPSATYTADQIYSTLPAHVLAPLIGETLPELPMASVVTVGLGYDRPVLGKEGFGYLIPSSEKEAIMGCVFDSCVFPEQGEGTRLTVMMGGAHRPELIHVDDGALIELALGSLERHLGLTAYPQTATVGRARNAIPQYPVGYAAPELSNPTLLGTSFHGVSINDCVKRARSLV